jgi:hypothetical protein
MDDGTSCDSSCHPPKYILIFPALAETDCREDRISQEDVFHVKGREASSHLVCLSQAQHVSIQVIVPASGCKVCRGEAIICSSCEPEARAGTARPQQPHCNVRLGEERGKMQWG